MCTKNELHFVAVTEEETSAYSLAAAGSVKAEDLCFDAGCAGAPDCADGSPCGPGTEQAGHMHAHLKSECADGASRATTLLTLKKGKSTPFGSKRTDERELCATATDCGHVHTDTCGHEQIAHGDHMDYLVPGADGSLELHHACHDDKHCHVHGVLKRLQDIKDEVCWFVFNGVDGACPCCPPPPPPPPVVGLTRTTLFVEGICCPSEVPIIERLLSRLPGVIWTEQNRDAIKVNVTAKTTIVMHTAGQTTAADLVLALNNGGSLGARIHSSLDEKSKHRFPKWNVLVSGLLWAISMVSLLGKRDDEVEDGSGIPEELVCEWCDNLKWVAIAGIVMGWPPILLKAFGSLKVCVLDINMLMTLAVAGAIAIGDYVEGAAVVFLFALSEWLEGRAGEKARVAIAAVLDMKPAVAVLMDNKTMPVDKVEVGTRLKIMPGTRVPLDGTVVAGVSTVDESSLTGESKAVCSPLLSPSPRPASLASPPPRFAQNVPV